MSPTYPNLLLNFPITLEDTILAYLKAHYIKKSFASSRWNSKDVAYFSRGIVALNEGFTQNKTGRHLDYFNDPVMRSGYLAYFLPVNIMKAYGIFRQHPVVTEIPRQIFVADVGAGPLTLSFAFILHLQEQAHLIKERCHVVIDAYDINRKILVDGEQLLIDYLKRAKLDDKITVSIHLNAVDVHRAHLKSNRYDFILMGNFINEFEERDEQQRLLHRILAAWSDVHTKILFLEPGSKKVTRDLQALRDQLIESGEYTVLAPCLHQHTCPLNLTAKGDWCNFTQDWCAPDFIKDFDEITDLKKKYLLYSYLLMEVSTCRRADVSTLRCSDVSTSARQHIGTFIAISDVMREKGRLEVVGCGPAGRIRFVRSNNDASEANRDFEWIRRGQVFNVETSLPAGRHGGRTSLPDDHFQLNINVPVKKETKFVVKKG